MKFGQEQKIEFKKSYELYCKSLVRVLAKVAINFVHFAWHGQKRAKCYEYLIIFKLSLSKFNKNLSVFYRIKQNISL
jgi:hypothetical protein